MDVVKTNIQRLNGRVEIDSTPGAGTTLVIDLPLTLAILPVLVVRLDGQSFALPLAIVREIMRIDADEIRSVAGQPALVVRDEVLPVRTLSSLLGLPRSQAPQYGVLLETATSNLVLGVDGFEGRDDVVIKPLEGFRAKGIAGATQSGDGSVLLVLDVEALFGESATQRRSDLLAIAA
jgi:two-component system chemotaxis sensor kinase CheA